MNNVERLKNYQNRNAATIEAMYCAVLQDRAKRGADHEETAWFGCSTKTRAQKTEKADYKDLTNEYFCETAWIQLQVVL